MLQCSTDGTVALTPVEPHKKPKEEMFGEHLLKRFVYLAFHSVSCYTHHKWVHTFCRIDHPLLIQQVFIDSKKIITYCVCLHFEFCREISNFPSSHQSCYRCHLKKKFFGDSLRSTTLVFPLFFRSKWSAVCGSVAT